MISDATDVSVRIKKRIKIRDRRKIVVAEIQKTLCGKRKSENLIESTFFELKFSQVHVFLSKR